MKTVDKLVIEGLGASFKGDDVRNFLRPCVYCFMSNDEIIYVGLGRRGITRPFQHQHQQSDQARASCTEMRVWFCKSIYDAEELERILLDKFKPRFNKIGVREAWKRLRVRLGGLSRSIGDATKGSRLNAARDFEDLLRLDSRSFKLLKE